MRPQIYFLITIWIIFLFPFSIMRAQSPDSSGTLTFSGFAEIYYSYDFGAPANHTRPGFVFSHNRHNEVNLNLGFIKAGYNSNNVRGFLALMTGTYANANLSAEPGVLKNIFEASVGIRLTPVSQTWVDAGIFSSHIGFESAVSSECWTLTRSILADNSPYYESGVKLSHSTSNRKWLFSALLLNGWQRILKADGNQLPSFGTQITFEPMENLKINSSTYFGIEGSDSIRQNRLFHNLYGIIQLNKKLGVIVGFDSGIQQRKKEHGNYNPWYDGVLILRYQLHDKWSIAGRIEYYSDEFGVIVNENNFKTFGYSMNLDCRLYGNVLWRIEGRIFKGDEMYFTRGGQPTDQNVFLTTALSLGF